MTIILGNLQLLEEERESILLKDAIEATKRIQKLTAILTDLMTEREYEFQPIILSDVITNAISATKKLLKQSINMSLDIEDEIIIDGSKTHIEKLIINTIISFLKISPDTTKLDIKTEKKEKDAIIYITAKNKSREKTREFSFFPPTQDNIGFFKDSSLEIIFNTEILKHHNGKMYVERNAENKIVGIKIILPVKTIS